jgi:hypothetical protein
MADLQLKLPIMLEHSASSSQLLVGISTLHSSVWQPDSVSFVQWTPSEGKDALVSIK